MKRILIVVLLLGLVIMVGCVTYVNNVEKEHKVTIPVINITAPDGIEIEVYDADPVYRDHGGTQESICLISYIVRNNGENSFCPSIHRMVVVGYAIDGKLIFEKDKVLLPISELAPMTFTSGSFNTGFIRGVRKIEMLDIRITR